jgi:hypothetical protein
MEFNFDLKVVIDINCSTYPYTSVYAKCETELCVSSEIEQNFVNSHAVDIVHNNGFCHRNISVLP